MTASNLVPDVNRSLGKLMLSLKLTLLNGRQLPVKLDDPAAIVSNLPHINIESGRDTFGGRRRRLWLRSGKGQVSLLARIRPVPEVLDPFRLRLQWGEDRRKRRVPVAVLDPATYTSHVLMELDDVVVLEASPGQDPGDLIAAALFTEPLEALLAEPAELRIGPDVRRSVQALMGIRPWDGSAVYREEMTMLEGLATHEGLPATLTRRLERLKQALGCSTEDGAGPRGGVSSEVADLEVERLGMLVSDRACGWLRFGTSTIEGLINPGFLGQEWRLYPRLFRLQLGPGGLEPRLHLWSLNRTQPGGRGECLDGPVEHVLEKMDTDSDVYGLIDTVLNFRETMHRGAVPVHDRPPRGRLESLFATIF